MSNLSALRERVESATGPSEELDREIHEALVGSAWFSSPVLMKPAYLVKPVTASVDAVLALAELKLPALPSFAAGSPPSSGWKISLYRGMIPSGSPHAFWEAMIRAHATQPPNHTGPTPALALLAALLAALDGDTPNV